MSKLILTIILLNICAGCASYRFPPKRIIVYGCFDSLDNYLSRDIEKNRIYGIAVDVRCKGCKKDSLFEIAVEDLFRIKLLYKKDTGICTAYKQALRKSHRYMQIGGYKYPLVFAGLDDAFTKAAYSEMSSDKPVICFDPRGSIIVNRLLNTFYID